MRSAILEALAAEIELHQETIPENDTWLVNAVEGAFAELRKHGVREAGEPRALELPLFWKIKLIIDVLKSYKSRKPEQCEQFLHSNETLFSALKNIHYKLGARRIMSAQTTQQQSALDDF